MAETTAIAWADSTFNPWIGCTKVSPGCDNCYAAVSTPARTIGVQWGPGNPRHRTSAANWAKPLAWNRAREKDGKTHRVFCSSLADVFDNEVPHEWRSDLFSLFRETPYLTWLVLTKRVNNARSMSQIAMGKIGCIHSLLPPNVWIGATVVNQDEADRDILKLFSIPAAKLFVSYEPALGAIDFRRWLRPYCDNGSRPTKDGSGGVTCHRCNGRGGCRGIDWIIVGGESDQPGMKARPFDVEWARSTVRQCKAAGGPVFVKQVGSNAVWSHETSSLGRALREGGYTLKDRAGADPAEWPADLRVQEFPA